MHVVYTFGADTIKHANIPYDHPERLILSHLSFVPIYLFKYDHDTDKMKYDELETLKKYIHFYYRQDTRLKVGAKETHENFEAVHCG